MEKRTKSQTQHLFTVKVYVSMCHASSYERSESFTAPYPKPGSNCYLVQMGQSEHIFKKPLITMYRYFIRLMAIQDVHTMFRFHQTPSLCQCLYQSFYRLWLVSYFDRYALSKSISSLTVMYFKPSTVLSNDYKMIAILHASSLSKTGHFFSFQSTFKNSTYCNFSNDNDSAWLKKKNRITIIITVVL